jgi:hypothetical protein
MGFSEIGISLRNFASVICFMINSCIRWSFGLDMVAVVFLNLKTCRVRGRKFEKFWSLSFYNRVIILLISLQLFERNSYVLFRIAWSRWP